MWPRSECTPPENEWENQHDERLDYPPSGLHTVDVKFSHHSTVVGGYLSQMALYSIKLTSTFLERSKVSVALRRYAVRAVSNSLAAGSISCGDEEGGSCRIRLTCSRLVSTVAETERKDS